MSCALHLVERSGRGRSTGVLSHGLSGLAWVTSSFPGLSSPLPGFSLPGAVLTRDIKCSDGLSHGYGQRAGVCAVCEDDVVVEAEASRMRHEKAREVHPAEPFVRDFHDR